jgi:ankyrin repeat domain-containing protein 42
MEGHLPCLKFIVSVNRDIASILGARNDQGDTPKSLAEQFYKEECCAYLDALEWEHDHPEQAESKERKSYLKKKKNQNIFSSI